MATITVEQALELSDTHLQAGRLEDAERIYRQVLSILPDHADALHSMGLIALTTGRLPAAVELISRAIVQSPANVIYHANLGEGYRLLGQWENATGAFRKALALHPGLPTAQAGLGSALILTAQHVEAVALYEQILATQPDSPRDLLHYGVALHGLG